MKVRLKCTVRGSLHEVWEQFDKQLFTYLLPPGTTLVRFDGSTPGDMVHLRFPFNFEWISEITQVRQRDGHFLFIDQGLKLPGPLNYWKHIHHVYHINKHKALIVDDMEYSTGSAFLDLIFYPFLYLAFWPRTSLYKRYFQAMNNSRQLSTH